MFGVTDQLLWSLPALSLHSPYAQEMHPEKGVREREVLNLASETMM